VRVGTSRDRLVRIGPKGNEPTDMPACVNCRKLKGYICSAHGGRGRPSSAAIRQLTWTPRRGFRSRSPSIEASEGLGRYRMPRWRQGWRSEPVPQLVRG
jgi:hypothetical protein